MNPRGGHRGGSGNKRGRGQKEATSASRLQMQPEANFTFNPNAATFNPAQSVLFDPSVPPPTIGASTHSNQNSRQQEPSQNRRRRGGQQNTQRRQLEIQEQRGDSHPQNQSRQNNRNQLNVDRIANQQNKSVQNPSRNPGNSRRGQGARRREQKEEPLTEEETKILADKPLREGLVYLLENNKYECAICYTRITTRQGVWSCKTCYHIFHISTGCITDWARSSRDKEGANTWRCPTCQTENETMPYNYYCFCGRMRNPNFRVGEVPHSCGETCGGARKFGCPHPCTELCHPGPCIECKLFTTKSCNCGKTKKSVRCGSDQEVMCETVCGKQLSCGQHNCERICHSGDCGECTVILEQDCFCGKTPKEVSCNPCAHEKYSCGSECDGMFSCGIHHCTKKCHDKECGECETGANRIRTCPCGRNTLQSLGVTRKKCTDMVPTCDSVCDKWLTCGTPGKNHHCREKCHEGPCPPCNLNTSVICRCGTSKGVIPCDEYLQIMKTTGEYLCTKRCRKKKSCGMHKCQEVCCIQDEHFCLQMCNKRLSCGIHTCENVCHAGQCRPCLQASFDEQFCHCGHTVRMPPIPCGARLPVCSQPCVRPHSCDHSVSHKCHGEQNCPPCTQLTEKMCYGGHRVRKNIPCHIDSVSCGVVCKKPLKCGVHVCQRTCHGEECEKEGEKCTKKCETIRELCEHPCALPCHEDSPCEPSPCKASVRISCECGRIKKDAPCCEVDKMILSKLEKEEEEKSESDGEEKVVKEGILKRSTSFSQLNCMKCDDECKKLERNRKVAEALEVDTDEYGMNKLAPTISFPCYLKEMVRTNIDFVKSVEKILIDLVIQILSGEAYHDTFRAHLPAMSIEKRRFVHEYANFFNIASESVDSPPKRSIVLTAVRGKSHQPLVLISDLVNYKGALKTPGPAVIRKDIMDQALSKKEETEGLMKPLRCTEKMVVRREARPMKEITAPIPLKQQNQFALLGSDVDSDDEESNVPTTSNLVSSPPKDWWKDEEEGWQKVQQKEYVVEVERDMTEDEIEAAKKLDEGPTWEDQCDEDAPATETSSAIESPAKEEPVAELLE